MLALRHIRLGWGGQVFAPQLVRAVSIHDTSLAHRVTGLIGGGVAVLLAMLLAGRPDTATGAMVCLMVAALFGFLGFWHTKYPNLELRVLLHTGGYATIGSHDLAYLRRLERELKLVVHR